jgi:threonine/homoserine/homoserine lactone efflux protein
MAIDDWLLFMAIWIAASVPLGPNALNCISTSAAYGFRKGLWSAAGVFVAANIHMALALTGIAAFMNANPELFEALRWAGVAYLAWMGLSMLRSRGVDRIPGAVAGATRWQLIRRAVLISLSNPKAIFAWLAVFSQFVSAVQPIGPQLIVLAPSALSVTIAVYVGYCALGLGVNRIFRGDRRLWFDRAAGSTYLAFAYGLAVSDLKKA